MRSVCRGARSRLWRPRPESIQPARGGISRRWFWIPAHVAFEPALVVSVDRRLVPHDGARVAADRRGQAWPEVFGPRPRYRANQSSESSHRRHPAGVPGERAVAGCRRCIGRAARATQLHRGIAGSGVLLNYAVWESTEHFKRAFTHPEFRSHLGHYPSSVVVSPHLYQKVAVPGICVA
jgi:hypothetical protein